MLHETPLRQSNQENKRDGEMTEKSVGVDQENARLLPRLSTASSQAPVPGAGPRLDALIDRVVLGRPVRSQAWIGHYSTMMEDAWVVVRFVQALHPGWRFSLLGGDTQWGYRKIGEDEYEVVRSVSSHFGWRARFFGEQDPTIGGPLSHSDEHADTPALAICLAALKAVGG